MLIILTKTWDVYVVLMWDKGYTMFWTGYFKGCGCAYCKGGEKPNDSLSFTYSIQVQVMIGLQDVVNQKNLCYS